MTHPAIMGVWLRELDAEKGQLPMDKAIGKLRDEVTGVTMDRHRGNSRELSMVLTKLDEARQWAETYMQGQGSLILIPRADILQQAATNTTDETA